MSEKTQISSRQLILLSQQQMQRNQGDSAIKTALKALRFSSQSKDIAGIDTALKYIDQYDKHEGGDNGWNEHILKQIITILLPYPQKNFSLAKYYYKLAGLYHDEGNFIKALVYYEQALNILTSLHSTQALRNAGLIYASRSRLWVVLMDKGKTLESITKAEHIAKKTNDMHLQMQVLRLKGNLYYQYKEYDSAYHYFSASHQLYQNHPGKHPLVCTCPFNTVVNLAHTLLQKHQADEALLLVNQEKENLDKAYQQQKKLGFAYNKADSRSVTLKYLQAYAYFEKKDYKKVEAILAPLLPHLRKEPIDKNEANIQDLLSALYDSTGQYQKAYKHKARYAELNDVNRLNEEKGHIINQYYELEKEKALYEKKELIARQQQKISEKNLLISIAVGGALLLAISLVALYRNRSNKLRLQASSLTNLQQQQEINQLQAKIEGEEQERGRIARELHDGIVSQLLSLKLNVNTLQSKTDQNIQPYELNEVALQISEATEDLRHTAHNLMPDLLLQRGLVLSLATLCEKINRTTPLETDFQVYGEIPRLTQETELTLYRMVQELVQNALKHARATQLLVQIGQMDELFSITVEDNGKGIPAMAAQPGNEGTGLRNIRRRVQLLQGHLDIQSKKGIRTTVYMEFPLKALS